MQIGLCTISNGEAPIETVLEHAAEAGYDGVEVWGRDHVGSGDEATCRAIVDAADERGLEILVYGSYLRPGTDGYADTVEHELAVADRLGADRIRVWAGSEEFEDCSTDHWDAVVGDLRDLTDRIAELNGDLEITVEKHGGTVTNTLEGAETLITEIDDENCRLNYQPMFSIPEATLLEEAERLAPLSNNVHVQSVPECGAGGEDRCLLERSFYDVESVLEPFLEGSFDGSVNVEFVTADLPYAEAIEADCRYLRSILE